MSHDEVVALFLDESYIDFSGAGSLKITSPFIELKWSNLKQNYCGLESIN